MERATGIEPIADYRFISSEWVKRVADALLPNRRGAVYVRLQMVVGQTAGFVGVRLDVPWIRRPEPAGVSQGGPNP
jgi:hypothetical protein